MKLNRINADRGASALEYAGLVALAGLVVGSLYAAGVSTKVGASAESAVCRILGGEDCSPSVPATPVAARPPSSPNTRLPSAPGIGGGRRPGFAVPIRRDAAGSEQSPANQDCDSPPPPADNYSTAVNARAIDSYLNKAKSGQGDIRWARSNGVKLTTSAGAPEYSYCGSTRKIYVDEYHKPVDAVAQYVGTASLMRTDGDVPIGSSREDYIDGTAERYAHALILEEKTTKELKGPDADPDPEPLSHYNNAYRKGVNLAVKLAKKDGRHLTPEQKESYGDKAGQDAVAAELKRGEFAMGVKGGTTRADLGRQWDRAHGITRSPSVPSSKPDSGGCPWWKFAVFC